MTVGELRNWLRDFDPDMEVRIGMYQERGSNFAYEYERRILLDNTDADSCWDFLQKLPAERHKNIEITPCMAK